MQVRLPNASSNLREMQKSLNTQFGNTAVGKKAEMNAQVSGLPVANHASQIDFPQAALAGLKPLSVIRFGSQGYTYPVEQNIIFDLKNRAEKAPNDLAMQISPNFYTDITSAALLTNKLLYENTLKVAKVLKEKYNIQPGDKVATIETNTPEFFMTMFATLALGGTIVPINILPLADKTGANEILAHLLKESKPKALFIGKTIEKDKDLRALMGLRRMAPFLKPHRKYVRYLASGLNALSKVFPGYFKVTRDVKKGLQNFSLMMNSMPSGMKIIAPKDTSQFTKMVGGQPIDEKHIVTSPDPESTALMLFTSGSTGMPKAVPISHKAMVHNIESLKEFTEGAITKDDKQLVILPQFHIFGLTAFLAMLSKGVKSVLIPSPTDGARNPGEMLNTVASEGITVMPLVPKITERLIKEPGAAEKLKNVKMMMSGGERLDLDLYLKTKQMVPGMAFWQGYGSTEAGIITINKDEPIKDFKDKNGELVKDSKGNVIKGNYGSVGGAISKHIQLELKDKDEQGQGEIWVKTPSMCRPYPGVAAEDLAESFKPDGWYNMQDLGLLDARNEVSIVGRTSEIIKRAGERMAPNDFDDRMLNTFNQKTKTIKDAITFRYIPAGTNKEKVFTILLMADASVGETEDTLKAKLQEAVKAGDLAGRYVPDYILPYPKKHFPEGFISQAMGKKQPKKCRAYVNDMVKAGVLQLGDKNVKIVQPEKI